MRKGQYYAVRWTTLDPTEFGISSPAFDTIEECRQWLNGSENYVIRLLVFH